MRSVPHVDHAYDSPVTFRDGDVVTVQGRDDERLGGADELRDSLVREVRTHGFVEAAHDHRQDRLLLAGNHVVVLKVALLLLRLRCCA